MDIRADIAIMSHLSDAQEIISGINNGDPKMLSKAILEINVAKAILMKFDLDSVSESELDNIYNIFKKTNKNE